jgi:PadR family transcriptional regulator AphA
MTLAYILLGLLLEKPMAGYDLKTFFKNSVNFFWTAKLSQVYVELSKLEKQGYISSTVEPQERRPNKKIYKVTDRGQDAFLAWLAAFPEDLISVPKNEFLVRIFFSHQLPEGELIRQFERYIVQQEECLKVYESLDKRLLCSVRKDEGNTVALCQRFTVRRGIYFTHSEISWAKECIEEIRRR